MEIKDEQKKPKKSKGQRSITKKIDYDTMLVNAWSTAK
jgi:hypothetical protein